MCISVWRLAPIGHSREKAVEASGVERRGTESETAYGRYGHSLNLRSGVGRLAPQLQSGKKSYVTDELSIFRLVTA